MGKGHGGNTATFECDELHEEGRRAEPEELLAHRELDEVRWEAASAAFDEDMLDDVEGNGALTDELAARASWTRAIPPLDEDMRAWLDFYRAFATTEALLDLLDEHGLRPADILRLHGL